MVKAALIDSAPPKFCIFGAGAIGGMVATLLARCGARVSVVARGQTLATIKRTGIHLVSNGEEIRGSVRASDDPSALGVQDYVIVATKAPAVADIARRIGPLLGPETAVVTAMNGVPWWFFLGTKGRLADRRPQTIDPDGRIDLAIPIDRVIGCVVYVAASQDGPGVVRHQSDNQLVIGEPDNRLTPRLERLGAWFRSAGFECRESLDIRADIWLKLWGNISLNPISLLTTTTSDRIVDDPLTRGLSVSMMEETARIGEAIGIPIKSSPVAMIERIRKLGVFKTSMLQDVERGTPVEIDALLTAPHEIGRLVGVATPFIDAVLGLARLRADNLGLIGHAHGEGGPRRSSTSIFGATPR